ncbi:hypothetical protein HLB44_10370 [Aquincola sp. S2]|uniref:Uncharacterized protein n=1 Tax=Pseudaquabacterium terrae TaxID=2732868 RepID=A0ABX2EFJ6_9BURK|nr:hypothetical protein [Aquabacterium terrae]NRF67389.1 hypothetical protein [Aquabacterium terrae]
MIRLAPRLPRPALALVLSTLLAGVAHAAGEAPAAKAPAKKPAAKAEQHEPATEAQLAVAMRVLTGDADCEFKQTISVTPIEGHAGHFNLTFKKVSYRMVPQETTTGAVRLEDKKAGMIWIQIPAKSMLMNAKIGQRVVDDCTHSEQRAAVAAAAAAGRSQQAEGSIGISPAAASTGVAPRN